MPVGKNLWKMQQPIGKTKRRRNRKRKTNNSRLNNLGRAVEDAQKGVSDIKKLVSFSNNTSYANDSSLNKTRDRRYVSTPKNSNPYFYNTLNRKLMNDYCSQYFDYLLTLAHPWSVSNALIPDWTAFPRGTAQIRTVGTITTGTTSADDTFVMTILPCLQKSGFFLGGVAPTAPYITIDGVQYGANTPSVFSVHNFLTEWASILDSYRVVSMGVRVKYIGAVLNTAGAICCGTLPPESNPATTYDILSDYNYAYIGKAQLGCTQVWLPAGIQAFSMYDIGDQISTDDQSFIQISAKGLPLNAAVMEVEWVMNIEVYSTSQVLTANARGGKPDSNKLSTATAAMASAHASGSLNGSASSAKAIGKSVLRTGAKLAGPAIQSALAASDEGFWGMLSAGAESMLATLPELLLV